MNERFFSIDGQWNVVHLPEQPNGFGVLLLGDRNYFVQSNNHSWLQNPERKLFLQELTQAGYTVFSSNLYGNHWGSEPACQLALQLHHVLQRQEILNDKVHIIAEGMGALVAIKLIQQVPEQFRSAVLINPCLHLYRFYKKERKTKLFYKRLLYELSEAYGVDTSEVEAKVLKKNHLWQLEQSPPIRMVIEMGSEPFSLEDHGRRFEHYQRQKGMEISLSLHLPKKPFSYYAHPTLSHFKKNEKLDKKSSL